MSYHNGDFMFVTMSPLTSQFHKLFKVRFSMIIELSIFNFNWCLIYSCCLY